MEEKKKTGEEERKGKKGREKHLRSVRSEHSKNKSRKFSHLIPIFVMKNKRRQKEKQERTS